MMEMGKLVGEVPKISGDFKVLAKEIASGGSGVERGACEMPKTSIEYFVPAKNIVKKSKISYIQKLTDQIKDLNDTELIDTICEHWSKEYDILLRRFSPERMACMKDPRAAHQAAIDVINRRYKPFTEKIDQLIASEKYSEKAMQFFMEKIEPINQKSMETFSKIDINTHMSQAYEKVSNNFEQLTSRIEKCESLEDVQKVILDVENLKLTDEAGYEKANKLLEQQLEKINEAMIKKSESGAADTMAQTVQKTDIIQKANDEKNAIVKFASMDAKELQKEIEKLTVEEVMEGSKIGQIYSVLEDMRLRGHQDYSSLNGILEQKLSEVANVAL